MAAPDFSPLVAAVSPDEPCGPDLVETGDAVFMYYLAHAQGLLPSSFFMVRDGKSHGVSRRSPLYAKRMVVTSFSS